MLLCPSLLIFWLSLCLGDASSLIVSHKTRMRAIDRAGAGQTFASARPLDKLSMSEAGRGCMGMTRVWSVSGQILDPSRSLGMTCQGRDGGRAQ